MPKLTANAPKQQKQQRMKDEMDKFQSGQLHSGSKTGPLVNSRKQAIAIGLSESGQSNYKSHPKRGPRKVIKAKV